MSDRRRPTLNDGFSPIDQFRLLVEGVHDYAILGLDVDGLVMTWNSGAERIKGYAPEEIVGRHFSVFYLPADLAAGVPAAELAAATAKGSVETEGWRVRKDGSRFWASVVITALFDGSHHLSGFAKVTRDITERRDAALALRDSAKRAHTVESRLAAVVESSSDAIASWSLDGTITTWNGAAKRLVGHDADEMVGRNVLQLDAAGLLAGGLLPAERSHEISDIVQRVTQGNCDGNFESRHIRKDGTVVDMSLTVSPVHDALGTLIGMSVVARDITERKRHDQELADERRRLRAAESIGHIGSWEMDAVTGRVVYSDTLLELYGVHQTASNGDATGIDGLHRDDRAEVNDAIDACRRTGEPLRTRYRLYRADDGELRWFDISGERIDEDGQHQRLMGAVVDVTELVLAAKTAEEARDVAVEASRQKSAFLATMSHEIRTPMNAVIGLTGLLLDTALDGEQREFVETVRSSGDLLLGIINDILDFSKIEAGGLELELQPFDLRACVEDALDVVGVASNAKGLELLSHVDERCAARVVGDVTRLRQVLVNLLANAVKFTPHGQVVLTVEPVEPVESDPAPSPPGGVAPAMAVLRFAVADTGIGIPADRIASLFDAFSQVDASTTRVHGGTGLGLAISHRLVEAMGATLKVDTLTGVGSTFHFAIPFARSTPSAHDSNPETPTVLGGRSTLVVDDDPANPRILRLQMEGARPSTSLLRALLPGEPPSAPPTPEGPGRVLRVLIVEDNRINQLVARRSVEKLGHRVNVVGNGREAVDAVHLVSYDAVLMDIQMPEMDGLEATRLIRLELPAHRQPRIVAMTASVLIEDRQACHDAGMDDYLPKPVRIEDLDAALRQTVSTHPH